MTQAPDIADRAAGGAWGAAPTPSDAPLRGLGLQYLIDARGGDLILPSQAPRDVMITLAQQNNPRFRASLIALFLLHPVWSAIVLEDQTLPPDIAETLTTFLLAALYLHQQWYFQLTVALEQTPQLPVASLALHWQRRQLPAPWVGWGIPGLNALERDEQRRTRQPWAYASDWSNQVDHLIHQERQRRSAQPDALSAASVAALLPPPCPELQANSQANSQDAPMSEVTAYDDAAAGDTLAPITRATIEQFLRAIGHEITQPARLTLGTMTSLVWLGVLPASSTLDLALGWGAAPAMTVPTDEVEFQLAQARTRFHWDVFWPGQAIPLPRGWSARAQSVGRFGRLDVFTCDPLSIALAALARGTSQDFALTLDLLKHHYCTLAQLTVGNRAIVPRLPNAHLMSAPDPAMMAINLAAVRRWREAHR